MDAFSFVIGVKAGNRRCCVHYESEHESSKMQLMQNLAYEVLQLFLLIRVIKKYN